MAILVGDLIVAARAEAPDACSSLAAPATPVLTPAVNASGALVAATAIYVVVTATNQWGETKISAEANATPAGAQNSIGVAATLPPGATGGRAYYGTVAGTENQYVALDVTGAGTILGLALGTASPTPTRSTAWQPDSDGGEIGAYQMYRWLNDGLTRLAELAGGIFDGTGIAGTVSQMYYVVPGRWLELKDLRFDQWWSAPGSQADIFYRYNVQAGVVAIMVQEVRSYQTVIAAWPQPSLSGNTTALTQNIGTTDTSFTVTDASSFTANGRIQIDNEVMLFGQVNATGAPGSIGGLVRGVGGTRPASHTNGATVTELKLSLTGYRYSPLYAVGDSALTLDAAPGWEEPMHLYLLSRYKHHEQEEQEAAGLLQQFEASGAALRNKRPGAIRKMQQGRPFDQRIFGGGYRIIS